MPANLEFPNSETFQARTSNQSLLSVVDLAQILGLSVKSIYSKIAYHPNELPPRIRIPGSRLNKWHPEVVSRWLNELAGLIPPIEPPPAQKRRPGRPTKKEQVEHPRGGGRYE